MRQRGRIIELEGDLEAECLLGCAGCLIGQVQMKAPAAPEHVQSLANTARPGTPAQVPPSQTLSPSGLGICRTGAAAVGRRTPPSFLPPQ